jgi:hypothetical protein
VPLCTERERVAAMVDLRMPGVLGAHTFGWGPSGPGARVRVGDVRAGTFGQTGLRDLHLVSTPTGARTSATDAPT